ncbi:MAG: hypothetical protein IIA50_00160, partial [Bacteroidetes bacterium]|nr:hypothetical protein [Bacteroidota bacterium]
AAQEGCRFDAWTEHYDHAKWMKALRPALAAHGLCADDYLRERQAAPLLPWDHIDAGILKKHSVRKTIRRDEILYHVAAGRVRIRYDLENAEIREMVRKAVGSMLRVTKRDFDRGLTSENAVTTGPSRNIRGSRFKAWLSREEIAKINEHMKSVVEILLSSRRAHDRRLHAFTYVLTPLEERPARRN